MSFTIQQIADRYKTTTRTIFKWQADGVDVRNDAEIAAYLCRLKNPKLETVLAARDQLKTRPKTKEPMT